MRGGAGDVRDLVGLHDRVRGGEDLHGDRESPRSPLSATPVRARRRLHPDQPARGSSGETAVREPVRRPQGGTRAAPSLGKGEEGLGGGNESGMSPVIVSLWGRGVTIWAAISIFGKERYPMKRMTWAIALAILAVLVGMAGAPAGGGGGGKEGGAAPAGRRGEGVPRA